MISILPDKENVNLNITCLCICGFKETKPEKVEMLFLKYFLILKAVVTKK